MVRVTNAPSSRRRRKKLLKKASGFWGDRKNHIRQSANAVMSSMAFNYRHRKKKKNDFRRLWITRIGIAAKMTDISYSRMMCGLKKAGCTLNRKILSEIALNDQKRFNELAQVAKNALKP
jgi:large subunit ribosomal protein L20